MVKFNMKKKIAKALVFAMVMGTVGVHGVGLKNALEVAKAEEATLQKTVTSYTSSTNTLSIDISKLAGNYVYVSYYTDEACTKLKSTAVYTREEVTAASSMISLGNLALKKGGFFKVYDEKLGADGVETFKVDPQAAKIKVKVVDASKAKFFEALQITVGTEKVTADTLSKYNIDFNVSGNSVAINSETAADKAWEQIKIAARANGLTVQVVNKLENDKNGMASEAKFKVAAAPKAPKVTVDYVNGTYAFPKGVKYVVTTVDTDGIIAIPNDEAVKGATTTYAKESKSADELMKGLTGTPTKAAIVMWSEKAKKMDSMQTVFVVEKLGVIGVDYGTNNAKKEVGTLKFQKATEVEAGTFSGDEIAKLTFTATGVTIEAKSDMAYYANGKWTTVKASKSTKEIAVAAGSKIKMKALGMKATATEAGKFGSSEVEVTNEYAAAPITKVTIKTSAAEKNITITNGTATLEKPDASVEIYLEADVIGENLTDEDKAVSWTVKVVKDGEDATVENLSITTAGKLSIPANSLEKDDQIVVTVTSKSNESKTDTLTIKIIVTEEVDV